MTVYVALCSMLYLCGLKEIKAMEPLYTLVLCLPAVLVLMGVAVLWPSAPSADHPVVGQDRGSRRPV
jgi:hypothetical protein